MLWLRGDYPDCKKVSIVLSIVLIISYAFANVTSYDGLLRAIPSFEIAIGWVGYVLFVLITSIMNFLIFKVILIFAFRIGYRFFGIGVRDFRIVAERNTFHNNMCFITIFANIVIGAIGVIIFDYELYATLVYRVVRVVIRFVSFFVMVIFSENTQCDKNYSSRMVGGYGIIFAIMAALGI